MVEIITIEGHNLTVNNVTFNGAVLNAIGNDGGTQDPYTLFTVTGVVAVKIFAVCSTDVASTTGTEAVGTTLSPTGLIGTTTATAIDANEIWWDTTPDASVELFSVLVENIISQSIIMTTATANVTGGVVKFYCLWRPISPGATVVSTGV